MFMLLQAKARELRVKGYETRKNASHALNEEGEEFLWQSGQLGKHSAQALVNVNFKNVTEHFGLRGRQEHYSMMVEDFSIITSPDSSSSNSFSAINNFTGRISMVHFLDFQVYQICQCQLTKAQSHDVYGKGSELLYSQTQMSTSYC